MAYKELRYIIENLQERVNEQELSIKAVNSVLFEILEKKSSKFEEFKKDIKFRWKAFVEKNHDRIIKKTFTLFFYENFHELFSYFLHTFFDFDENSLKPLSKEKISDKIIFFEYNYLLNLDEAEGFTRISDKYQIEMLYGFSLLTGYLYYIVRLLGMIIRKAIQEKIFILLDAVIVKDGAANKNLNFMIIIKDSKDEIFYSYFNMVLYYFLRQIKGIPEEYYENLLKGREKLYQIAQIEYSSAKERLVDLLYYFYKKCNLLQSFSPLLDFFNFVGARVEDSVFSKVDIIKRDFLANLDQYSVEKKNSIIKFFNYLDKKSTLYSTFQANNLPSPRSQLNLFLLYMKYYFGSGLEALEVGDLLFLPDIFRTTLNQYNKAKNDVIGANSIKNIKEFLNFLSALSNIENIDLFFYKIFKKNISQLNYGFFKTFLKSLNSDFSQKIAQENENILENPLNTPFTFNIIVDHICRILYVLIDKIFMRSTPNLASKNFIDPRSRYIGKNIALRVLELFVFQDINYSDDVWPDYIISLNREQLKNELNKFNITISKEQFYSVEELVQIMITYNIQSFSDQPYHEEWLINEIIIPLNNLIQDIRNSVKDQTNEIEVYERLSEHLLSGIKDEQAIKDFKFICQQFAPFWKNVE
ncbi:MAG: hypothetical protein JSV23_00355 [Promethearchaeota archaeon]|nr:MAG: hypothetical protein JSV23_00355 [Candidatus Lokiarchaeota archaeon]